MEEETLRLLARFYGDIMKQDLVYLVTESHRIPVKMDPFLPKGMHHLHEDIFVGSPTSIRDFIESGKIIEAGENS